MLKALLENPNPDELRQHIVDSFSVKAMVHTTEGELDALTLSDDSV